MRQINFNKDWLFEKETNESRLKAFYGIRDCIKVDLPYDAMIREVRSKDVPSGSQSGFYPGGKYVYEKIFQADGEWKNCNVILEFEGIYGNCNVWFNGFLIKKNHNGYVGFYVDLTSLLNFEQENLIRIEVDNTNQPNSRWYTGSGIYRDVTLWIGKKGYIKNDSVKITTKYVSDELAQLSFDCVLSRSYRSIKSAICKVEIFEKNRVVLEERQEIYYLEDDEEIHMELSLTNPNKWNIDNPFLYCCRITIQTDEDITDSVEIPFGIRMVNINPTYGLLINEKKVNLQGTCIHHDNGIIGSETFVEVEEYRCKRLKEAGFNAIRSAHNPMSKAMLNACDKYGLLVMDELCDVWNKHKNPYDFADVFQEEVFEWIQGMINKDYNHPSVIMYSIGNEISEAGTKQGAYINRKLCTYFHKFDNTRYTVNSLNALNCAGSRLKIIMKEISERFQSTESKGGNSQGSNALNTFMSMMCGEKGEYFSKHPLVSEALEECGQSSDIIGLNYLSGRYELEKELHPNKTVLGTETYPADIYNLWNLVENNNHVIGDFTWTGYDYIGEAGVGIFHYDGNENFTSVYPERLAYIGDIDLIGNRRPISFYREIVYGMRKEPYVAVERMNHNGENATKTAWMFKDNISSWTWPGFEGKKANVDVYSCSEIVELFLNGKSIGIKQAGKNNQYIASFEVEYEPGEIKAVGYTKDNIDGEFVINTASDVTHIRTKKVTSNEKNIVYIQAMLTDNNGIINQFESKNIEVEVDDNLLLEGFGSANPSSEEDYFTNQTQSFDGYVMVAVRVKDISNQSKVIFRADSIDSATAYIGGKANEKNND